MSQTIRIKAVIDTVCPWCFIGKRRLEKAIKQYKSLHPETTFQLQWFPYQLNPTITEKKNKLEHYKSKFGARFEQVRSQITAACASEGITFSLDGVASNSFDSHRLIWWAKQFGKQDQVVEQALKLYVEYCKDIADHEALATAAEAAGLNKDEALAFLKSQEGVDEVRAMVKSNLLTEINGVPHYTINEKYAVSGAQDPDTLVNVFEQIVEAEKTS